MTASRGSGQGSDQGVSTTGGSRRRRLRTRSGTDRGSASLWLLALGLALFAASGAGAAVGAAQVASQRAQIAADLGALAGAARAVEGAEAACARAAELAARNDGQITGCVLEGFTLQITVEVAATGLPGWERSAKASARAGPIQG